MAKIVVQKSEISIIQISDEDYISLTDIAHSQMEEHIIIKWLSLKSTIEYIGEWEVLLILTLIIPNSVQLKTWQEVTTLFCL